MRGTLLVRPLTAPRTMPPRMAADLLGLVKSKLTWLMAGGFLVLAAAGLLQLSRYRPERPAQAAQLPSQFLTRRFLLDRLHPASSSQLKPLPPGTCVLPRGRGYRLGPCPKGARVETITLRVAFVPRGWVPSDRDQLILFARSTGHPNPLEAVLTSRYDSVIVARRDFADRLFREHRSVYEAPADEFEFRLAVTVWDPDLATAQALFSAAGSAIRTANAVGSPIGLALAVGLAAALVGREYQFRTWPQLLVRSPQRASWLVRRLALAAGLVGAVALAVWAVEAILLGQGVAGEQAIAPRAMVDAAAQLPSAAELLRTAAPPIALGLSLGLAATIVARSLLGGLALSAGILVADSLASHASRLRSWTLAYNVWSVGLRLWGRRPDLDPRAVEQVGGLIWRYPLPLPRLWPTFLTARSEGLAGLYLGAVIVALLGLAFWSFRRQEHP